MKKFSLSVLPLLLVFATGCVKRKSVETKSASFQINKQITWKSYVEDYSASGLAKRKRYEFTACVEDLQKFQPISGHEFKVLDDKHVETVRSNGAGCFSWSRSFNYTVGITPVWIGVKFKIHGSGIHSGQALAHLAINPWKTSNKGFPEVVDLSFNPDLLPKEKLHLDLEAKRAFVGGYETLSQGSRPQLWVEDIVLNIGDVDLTGHRGNEKGRYKGGVFDIEIKGNPSIRVKDEYGDFALQPLRKGKLHVKMYLLQEIYNGSRKVFRTDDGSPLATGYIQRTIGQGTTDFKASTTLKMKYLPPRGTVEVALRIRSDNTELEPFEGVFTLDTMKGFLGTKRATLKPEIRENAILGKKRFSLKSYVTFPDASRLGKEKGFSKLSYLLSRPQVKFSAISKGECETATQRVVDYTVKSCVYSPITLLPVPDADLHIKIKKSGEPDSAYKLVEKDKTKRLDGCVFWEGSLPHSFYDREHYIKQDVLVENKELGIEEKMEIVINPWDYGFTFGRDYDQLDKLPIEPHHNSPRPEIIIHRYAGNMLGQKYIIDDKLNLDIVRTFRYQFNPRVKRYDSIPRGLGGMDHLRDGAYIARFVLARHEQEAKDGKLTIVEHVDTKMERAHKDGGAKNLAPIRPAKLPEYITSYEEKILVRDSVVTVDIPMTMREIELFGARNSFILELIPADPKFLVFKGNSGCEIDAKKSSFVADNDSGLKTTTYEGPQLMLEARPNATMRPVAYTATEIENQAVKSRVAEWRERKKKYKELEKQSNHLLYAKREALAVVDLSKKSDLDKFLGRLNEQPAAYEIAYNRVKKIEKTKDQQEMMRSFGHNYAVPPIMYNEEFPSLKIPSLDQVSESDIMEVVEKGIFPSTVFPEDAPGYLKNFAAQMCGYWFRNFYQEQMNEEQFDSFGEFLKHKEVFQYSVPWLVFEGDRFTEDIRPEFPFVAPKTRVNKGSFSRSEDSYFHKSIYDYMKGNKKATTNPLVSCLKDPYSFFHFDKKVVVEKVDSKNSDGTLYVGGKTQNYNVNQTKRVDQSIGWDISKGYDFGVGGSLAVMDMGMAGGGVLGFGGIRAGGDWKVGTGQKNGRYRGHNLTFSQGPYLVITKVDIKLRLKKFRQCLVIRPRAAALSSDKFIWKEHLRERVNQLPYRRSGMMICTGTQESKADGKDMEIVESYFYTFQHFAGAGNAAVDASMILNRPFLGFMRGRDTYEQFLRLTRGIVELRKAGDGGIPEAFALKDLDPLQGTVDVFKAHRVADRTGFYPGIYTHVPTVAETFESSERENYGYKLFTEVLDSIAEHNYLPWLDFQDYRKLPGQK